MDTGLTQISVVGIVLLVFNVMLGAAIIIIQFSMRRLVTQNDESHDRLTKAIEKIAADISAEREARHDTFKDLNDRVWSLNTDLKENYQTRREGMREYGTLAQTLNAHHKEVMDKIDALPCKAASCPPKGEQ